MRKNFRCMCRHAFRKMLQELREIYATNNLPPVPCKEFSYPNFDRHKCRIRKNNGKKGKRHEQNK